MTSVYKKQTERHANFTVWSFDVRNIPTQTISKIKYHVTEKYSMKKNQSLLFHSSWSLIFVFEPQTTISAINATEIFI